MSVFRHCVFALMPAQEREGLLRVKSNSSLCAPSLLSALGDRGGADIADGAGPAGRRRGREDLTLTAAKCVNRSDYQEWHSSRGRWRLVHTRAKAIPGTHNLPDDLAEPAGALVPIGE
jgi:hypothetical protein